MTVTPTVTGGTFEWILPDTSTATSKTVSTNDNGVAQFQWEPDPPTLSSSATVSEAVQPEYTPETYRCERRNPDGTVDVSSGPLTGSPPTFTITVGPEQIVTCALLNSFNYAPAIQVTKVNSPTEVRGDLTPPAEVTSSYAVTNPGNTPLSQLELTDDLCGLVDPVLSGAVNVGDTNADGRLDVTETWQFTCVREIQQSLITTPLSVTNTVTATGVDPEGSLVSDTATDDVEIITPAVTLAKLVGAPTAPPIPPAEEITVTSGTPPCEGPIFDGGDANDDGALDLTETWTYTCQSTVTQSVINTATVTGTPTRPTADPGPPVEATDAASVLTVTPDLVLTKEVDQDLVLPGTEVTYTFVAHNTGTADLRDPLDSPDDPPVPPDGWIEDDQCEPVTFVSGDVDGDGILNGSAGGAAETWTFTCSATIDVETLNEATIEAVTVAPAPVTLERSAPAIVRVVEPEIAVTKTALRGVVLDPAADAQSGPDVPDPREAVYLYEVSNLGSLPLADVEDRIDDDTCSPVSYDAGDTNADELLDLDEVWVFSCSDQLEKADGFPPDEPISSLVTNTVTAVGVPVLNDVEQPDFEVEDTDIAQVLVILPELTLTKTASASLVRPNTDVTYTYVAQNTGDVGLDPVAITDDRCAPVTLADGDNGNGLIDGANTATAETWTFTCTTNVGFPDPLDPVTNNAVISVLDPLGNTYVRDASATVALFDPGIDLDKTVSSELVPIGSTVTYDFTVTNAGDSPVEANDVLAGVTLNDASLPANPGCASPTFVGGDTNGNGAMERPETWTYQCTGVITQDTVDLAAVFGIDIQGTPIAALDAAYTGPFTPQIAVTKTAIPTSLMAGGGPVTYTYAVTNPGDVPLADVAGRFSDDTCSPATFVTGDVDGDGLLDTVNDRFEQPEDETWIFTCTTNVTDDTLNTVVVEGTPTFPDGELLCPQSPCDVRATAQATVGVVDLGSITIVKSASPKGSTTFGFTGSLGDFRLVGDGSSAGRRTVTGLTPGTYAVREVVPSGWRLDALTCADPMGGSTTAVADATATIGLAEGEAVTCTFVNKRNAGPPLPETGFGVGPPLRVALALILAGALLVAWSSLRRRGLAKA